MNPLRVFFSLMLFLPAPARVPAPPLPDETAGTITQPCGTRGAVSPAGVTSVPSLGEASVDSNKGAPVPLPTPLSLNSRKKSFRAPYLHAFEILKEDNSCSRFFGGPPRALRILNRFTERLEERRLPSTSVVIKMSGRYTKTIDLVTGAKYRLFDEVMVNSNALFYTGRSPDAELKFFGRFRSDTKQAKVLALLHELGHLVEGANGAWLLRDDGNNTELSLRNTKVVESRCIKQLLAIKD